MGAKEVTRSVKVCANCRTPIIEGDNHLSMVIDEDWDALMGIGDMLTQPLRWKHWHQTCPPTKLNKSKEKK
jgi:hypothetical protein